ncbi:tetratricopeptide repeat protein 16 isoform X1 [Varanus komodoensis]|uniref:tetratricopeptide repeat protein 16 isoform X1 n=2 Tax=Varanus komodoensis TaxID=61221 RepID=UPI001CF798A3|nr:tetratricopeptide repeat protein 16 isoform X1 [Varanus komodoensis]
MPSCFFLPCLEGVQKRRSPSAEAQAFPRASLDCVLQVELYERKAEALLQLCDFQSAAMHLRKAYFMSSRKESIGAQLAFIFHLQGQCLYEQHLFLDALGSFMRASELQPQNALYRMRSIACLASMNRYNDCLQMVNEEVAREEKNADLFVLRARLYEYFGKTNLTYFNLQNALELDPAHGEAQVLLAHLRTEGQKFRDQAVNKAVKGNLKAAFLKISRAICCNPVDASYFLFRGNMLRRLKDFSTAIDDYLKAAHLCSGGEEGHAVRAEAQKQLLLTYNDFAVHCYGNGCYEEAVLLLNKALKAEKGEKGLYSNRGDCFLKLGELNFAMADYQQALELRPRDPQLQKRVARLYNEMGLQEFRERRYPQAESYFSQAVENNPREIQYYLHRAKSRMFMQEELGAKEDLITALLLDPTRLDVHSLAEKLFPGEPVQTLLNSKVGELAKALLGRRLASCPACEALAQRFRSQTLVSQETEPASNTFIENDDWEKPAEKAEVKPQASEEKQLQERLAACRKKSHAVSPSLEKSTLQTGMFRGQDEAPFGGRRHWFTHFTWFMAASADFTRLAVWIRAKRKDLPSALQSCCGITRPGSPGRVQDFVLTPGLEEAGYANFGFLAAGLPECSAYQAVMLLTNPGGPDSASLWGFPTMLAVDNGSCDSVCWEDNSLWKQSLNNPGEVTDPRWDPGSAFCKACCL